MMSMMIDAGIKALLDAIALAEGHGRPTGYDTTFASGKWVEGEAPLTSMTLDDIAALQTRMIKRQAAAGIPAARRSSAAGRYQIISGTFRQLRRALDLAGTTLFSPGIQDRMAVHLLEVRGLGEWRAGTLSRTKFQNNLAHEWASIPRATDWRDPAGVLHPAGESHYGQGTGISQAELDQALDRAGALPPAPAPPSPPAPMADGQAPGGPGIVSTWLPVLLIAAAIAGFFVFKLMEQADGFSQRL